MKKKSTILLFRPVSMGMFLLSIVMVGIVALLNLSVELSPAINYPKLSVSSSWHNASPEVVEAYLTSLLESVLSTTKNVKKISSRSTEGNAFVDIEFHRGTNMDQARLEMNEKLEAIKDELPFGVSAPQIAPYIPSEFKDLQGFLTYSLSANTSADAIRIYAIENIKNRLLAIDGVSDVTIVGGNERIINLFIDDKKARALHISSTDISKATKEAADFLSTGRIVQGKMVFAVKVVNNIVTVETFADLPVKYMPGGTVVKMKDIGTVTLEYVEPTSFSRINGRENLFIEIKRKNGSNTLETAERVFAALKELQVKLPTGYILSKEVDKSESIRAELGAFYSSILYSIILIAVVLLLIYRKLKFAVIILISIVISSLLSVFLLFIFNVSVNIITLSSLTLGFGLIVDNSIVVLDYLSSKYTGRGTLYFTVLLKEIMSPILVSTLVNTSIFIPFVFFSGDLRLYFEQFAVATVFTLFSSFFVSFTAVPYLFFQWSRTEIITWRPPSEFFYRLYKSVVLLLLRRKILGFVILVLLIGLPVWKIPGSISIPYVSSIYNVVSESNFFYPIRKFSEYALGGSLHIFLNKMSKEAFWSDQEISTLFIRVNLPNGHDITRINALVKNIEKDILNYRSCFKIMTTRVIDAEKAYIRIEFTEQQGKSLFVTQIKNHLTTYAAQLGGSNISIYGMGTLFLSGGGEDSFPFTVQVVGYNYQKVRQIAEEFKNLISRNPRVVNVDIDRSTWEFEKTTYEVEARVNREKLHSNNIDIDRVIDVVKKNTKGNFELKKVKYDNEEISFAVKYSESNQMQLNKLADYIILNPDSSITRLGDLLSFSERKSMAAIVRENRQYVRGIAFDFMGPYKLGDTFLKQKIQSFQLPKGFKLENEQSASLLNDTEEIEIWKAIVLAVLLIFMITASLFESFIKPLLVVFIIPFAFVGTIYTFFFLSLPIDRGAYGGILLLIGISVNNSIVLIDYLTRNHKINPGLSTFRLCYSRVRPILATSLCTTAALIPLTLVSYERFWISLAISIIGGIGFSAIIGLIFVPVIYSLVYKKRLTR